MQTASGYTEEQAILSKKITAELSILPQIFTDYVSFLSDSQKSRGTAYSYLKTVVQCFRSITQEFELTDASINKIDANDILGYFDSRVELSARTLQQYWSALNSFFTFLMHSGIVSENPMELIERQDFNDTLRHMNHLNGVQLDKLLLSIRNNTRHFNAFRDETIIKLGIFTGIDIKDLVNLNLDDFDADAGTLHIHNSKGNRTIQLSDSIITSLKTWTQLRSQYYEDTTSPSLFVSSKKSRISADTINDMLRNYCKQADIPHITYKDLKSTMVYLLAKKRVPIESIMTFLDTSDYLTIVQAYDAAIKEYEVDLSESLSDLFDAPFSLQSDITPSHIFSLEIKPPEYAKYTMGGAGFTIYGNITNLTKKPIELYLKFCSLHIDGMLRTSDYDYSGYVFDSEFIPPNTTRTFGKIWITDKYDTKQLQENDYLLLCVVEVERNVEHHLKFIFTQTSTGSYWIEESRYCVKRIHNKYTTLDPLV